MKKTKMIFGAVLLVFGAFSFAQEVTENTVESASVAETVVEATEESGVIAELKDVVADDSTLSAYAAAIENSPVDPSLIEDGITILACDLVAENADGVSSANIGDYIIPGKITADELFTKSSLKTISGKELPVQIINNKFVVNGIELVATDSVTTESIAVHKLAKPFDSNLLGLN